jgi:hypothetical protein
LPSVEKITNVDGRAWNQPKISALSVIFYSPPKTKEESLKYAGRAPIGEWLVAETPGGGSTVHTEPFGSRVLAAWWTPIRDHSHNAAKWGFTVARPDGNRVALISSATDDAGHREGVLFVVYE